MKKFFIKVNGNEYEVEVEEINDSNESVQVIETPKPVQSAPKAAPSAPKTEPSTPKPSAADTSVPSGAEKVTAPMPGTILKINVNTNDSVKKGQVLMVLEAMKMENEITSPSDGTVASVNVTQGSAVNANDVLASIK